jgi:hypothetical protein
MGTLTYMGTIENIDINKSVLTIKMDFITPEVMENLLKYTSEKKLFKFSFAGAYPDKHTYEQQKCWYGSISEILKNKTIFPSPENIKLYDESMRRSIFPARKGMLDGQEIVYVPQMKDLSEEEMNECINILHSRHPQVDWEKFAKK